MNILFYRYGSICEPDIIASFKHLGFNITEDTREYTTNSFFHQTALRGLTELLKQDTYSFIFSINFFLQYLMYVIYGVFRICALSWTALYLNYSQLHQLIPAIRYSYSTDSCTTISTTSTLTEYFIFHLLPTSVTITLLQLWQVLLTEPDFHQIYHLSALYIQRNVYITKLLFLKKCVAMQTELIEAQLLVYGYNFIEECVTPELIEAFCKVRLSLSTFLTV